MILGAGGVIVRGNEVLMFLRKNTSLFNEMYSNAGGKQDEGETPDQTTVRELREELGIETKIIREIAKFHYFENKKLAGIFTGYLVEITSGEPRIMEPDKAEDLRYFPMNNLPENTAPFMRKYVEVLLEERLKKK